MKFYLHVYAEDAEKEFSKIVEIHKTLIKNGVIDDSNLYRVKRPYGSDLRTTKYVIATINVESPFFNRCVVYYIVDNEGLTSYQLVDNENRQITMAIGTKVSPDDDSLTHIVEELKRTDDLAITMLQMCARNGKFIVPHDVTRTVAYGVGNKLLAMGLVDVIHIERGDFLDMQYMLSDKLNDYLSKYPDALVSHGSNHKHTNGQICKKCSRSSSEDETEQKQQYINMSADGRVRLHPMDAMDIYCVINDSLKNGNGDPVGYDKIVKDLFSHNILYNKADLDTVLTGLLSSGHIRSCRENKLLPEQSFISNGRESASINVMGLDGVSMTVTAEEKSKDDTPSPVVSEGPSRTTEKKIKRGISLEAMIINMLEHSKRPIKYSRIAERLSEFDKGDLDAALLRLKYRELIKDTSDNISLCEQAFVLMK